MILYKKLSFDSPHVSEMCNTLNFLRGIFIVKQKKQPKG